MKKFLLTLLFALSLGVSVGWASTTVNLAYNSTEWTTKPSGTGYTQKAVLTTSACTVTLVNCSKQASGATIDDYYVQKNGDVILEMTDGSKLSSVTVNYKQWTTKTQTANIYYSIDGTNWIKISDQSLSNFSITTGALPSNVIAVKASTTNTSNQIGVVSVVYDVVSGTEEPDPTPGLEKANLSFGENTDFTIKSGDTFTEPKLTKDTDAVVTYSSDNDAVAIVDSETGKLDFKGGFGKVTITAKTAATETYDAGEAKYSVTVKDPSAPDCVTYVTSEQEYANASSITEWKYAPLTITFSKGTNTQNDPKYYDTSTGIRLYNGNTAKFTIAADYYITKIIFNCSSTSYVPTGAKCIAEGATNNKDTDFNISDKTATWNVPDGARPTSVLFTCGSTTPRIQSFVIYYAENKKEHAAPKFEDLTVIYGDAITPKYDLTTLGAITYSVAADNGVLKLEGNELKAIGGGKTTTVTASWAETAAYYADSTTFNVTVNSYEPKLAWSVVEFPVTLGTTVEYPTLTTTKLEEIPAATYSIEDEDVAMIDENDGFIIPEEIGTTKVWATIAADENGRWTKAEAFYTLTVEKMKDVPAPTFSVESGTYTLADDLQVSISTTVDGATIYFGEGTTEADATKVFKKGNDDICFVEEGTYNYVAYAEFNGVKSPLATATYVIIKAAPEFGYGAEAEKTLSYGDAAPVFVNTNRLKNPVFTVKGLDGNDVPKDVIYVDADGKINMFKPCDVVITAKAAGNDIYTEGNNSVTLHITEPIKAENYTTEFDFTDNAYGMTLVGKLLGTDNTYNADGTNFSENGVTIITKGRTRLYQPVKTENDVEVANGQDFRVNNSAEITLTVDESYFIKSISMDGNNPSYIGLPWENDGTVGNTITLHNGGNTDGKTGTVTIKTLTIEYGLAGDTHEATGLKQNENIETLWVEEGECGEGIKNALLFNGVDESDINVLVFDKDGKEIIEDMAGVENNTLEILNELPEGEYKLLAYTEQTDRYFASAVYTDYIVRYATPEHLYIHGELGHHGQWQPERYYEMAYDDVAKTYSCEYFFVGKVDCSENENHEYENGDIATAYNKCKYSAGRYIIASVADTANAPVYDGDGGEQAILYARSRADEGTAPTANDIDWASYASDGEDVHFFTINADNTVSHYTLSGLGDNADVHSLTPEKNTASLGDQKVEKLEISFASLEPTVQLEQLIQTGLNNVNVAADGADRVYDMMGRPATDSTRGIVVRVHGGRAVKELRR